MTKQTRIDQRFLDLYDRLTAITVSGAAAMAVFNAPLPNYALASL